LALYFLQYVDSQIAKRQLRGRVIFLRRIKRELQAVKRNMKKGKGHLEIILDHDLDLVEAEINSIARLTEVLT
jgi:hypothetical protein